MARSCLVSCRDLAGIEHAVEVTAESLYEAVAHALGILRGDIWVEEIGEGLTELKVRVKQPAVEHLVRMKDFRRWLEEPRQDASGVRKAKEAADVGERGGAGEMIGDWLCRSGLAPNVGMEYHLAGGVSTERRLRLQCGIRDSRSKQSAVAQRMMNGALAYRRSHMSQREIVNSPGTPKLLPGFELAVPQKMK